MISGDLDPVTVHSALSALLSNPDFRGTDKRGAFLKYVVQETLEGRASNIKGYTVGVDVYGRPKDFDPQNDPLVRLEAGRLRRDLEHYYLTAGIQDDVVFELPKGSYVPTVRHRERPGNDPPEPARTEAMRPSRSLRVQYWQAGLALIFAVVLGAFVGALTSSRLGGTSGSGALVSETGAATRQSTLFVAPFETFAPDPESDALARGLRQEVAAVISRFKDIDVFPVPAEVIDALGTSDDARHAKVANYVLLGNVRIVEDRVRIRAILRDANDGRQIWSELYQADYAPARVFDIQDSISHSVSRKLAEPHGVLIDTVRTELRERYDPGLGPYKCVLAGYEYRQTFSVEKHLEVRECLEKATLQEPEYARAWALLAYVVIDEARVFHNTRPNAVARAMKAAETAVRLDPNDPYSFQALSVAQFISGSIGDALDSAQTAVDLNPHNKEALWQLGYRHWLSGDYAKGTEIVKRAMDESPVYPPWYNWVLAAENYRVGDYEEALLHATSMGTPDLAFVEGLRAMIYAQLGRVKEAQRSLEICRRLDPSFDTRARDWYAVNQIQDDVLELFMDGLRKAGLAS
jgi:adenylate cyclase